MQRFRCKKISSENHPSQVLSHSPKIKDTTLKVARERKQITHTRVPVHLTTHFAAQILQAVREWNETFTVLEEKKLPAKNIASNKDRLQIQGKDKAILTETKAERLYHHQTSVT